MQQHTLFPIHNVQKSSHSFINRAELNEAQYEAVTTTDGPVLVIAGAGSGKTRTLVYRSAWLLEKGVEPDRILLLTFTRKAAQEMVTKASTILNDACLNVRGGTFHAIGNLMLRRYGHYLGYQPNFTIIDQTDAVKVVKLLLSALNFTEMGKNFPSQRIIVNAMSSAVNKSITLSETIHNQYWQFEEFTEELLSIEDHYKKYKFENGLMDYDDLLVNWKKVLTESDKVRSQIAGQFSFIMVDEYQDTNLIQAQIINLIGGDHGNVMAVGDDSQSIYSFRGADFKNIMEFPQKFNNCKIIRLEQNYRSTQPILTMTNTIIDNAAEKYSKNLFSTITDGPKPVRHGARNERDQACFVINTIESLKEENVPYQEIAVLFRSGYHSYKLELELTKQHIDFDKRGGQRLTEAAHIKDVLSHLRVITNPADNLSWNRILLLLSKVGPKTVEKILASIKHSLNPFKALAKYHPGKTWQQGFQALLEMLHALREPGQTVLNQFEIVFDYYEPIFERIYHDDYLTRIGDLEQLKTLTHEYPDLQSFINATALDPPGLSNGATKLGGDKKLILSTVHSAKGLEWDTVFIINLAEGQFPSAMARTEQEIEEERRLFYVAATRAKKRLYMIYPLILLQKRQGRYAEQKLQMSQFLAEIPMELTQSPSLNLFKDVSYRSTPNLEKKNIIKDNETEVGQEVKHQFFGNGTIKEYIDPKTVRIFFSRHGLKTINLDYAKMEVVKR